MYRILAVIFAATLIVIAGCGKKSDGADENGKLKIVTTIGMITDVVENVGGDRVAVTGLMGPGVDPHLYKAREGDVTRMADADIIFYNGLHLEGAMSEVMKQMGRTRKTAAVAQGIPDTSLISPKGYKDAHDPHVWFDVTMWMHATRLVEQVLADVDIAGADYYRQRSAAYLVELEQLHEYVKEQAGRVPADQRVLVTAHDAFNYFGRAYGFEVRGLQGISTAAEAGTAAVQQLAEFIADREIPAIFVESSVPPRNVEAVKAAVKSRGHNVSIGGELFSDAMGGEGTPEGTYVGMVRHNIDTIVSALLGQERKH